MTSHFRRGVRLVYLLGALAAPVVLIGGTQQATQKPASPKDPAEGQSPAFRAGVDLVSLNVSVSEGPRFVTDLQQEDFQVFEDGVKQDVTFFTRSNLPVALALLIDTSASMESRLSTAQEAAIGFARRLRQQDLAEVVDFDSRVVILQPLRTPSTTSSRPFGGRRPAGPRRCKTRFTSRQDSENRRQERRRNPETVDRRPVGRRGYVEPGPSTKSWISRSAPKPDYARVGSVDGSSSNGGAPRKPSSSSGSCRRRPAAGPSSSQLADPANVYGQISDELSSQYTVGYTSRNTRQNGAWRRVVVRVNRPNLTARTKQGYFAPTGK